MPTIKKPSPVKTPEEKLLTAIFKSAPQGGAKTVVMPKMNVLSDGPKGPKYEQKDVPELAKPVPEAHAKVYVEYSRKLSDGNYGSVGFTVGLQMPVGTAYHEIEEGFEAACLFVDGKLTDLLNAATKKE